MTLMYGLLSLIHPRSGSSTSRRHRQGVRRRWCHNRFLLHRRCRRRRQSDLVDFRFKGRARRSFGEEEAPSENRRAQLVRLRVGKIRSCGIIEESSQGNEGHGQGKNGVNGHVSRVYSFEVVAPDGLEGFGFVVMVETQDAHDYLQFTLVWFVFSFVHFVLYWF